MGIESRLIAKIDATKDSCALVACGSRRFSRGPIVIFVPRLAAGSLHNWPIVCLFLTARNACVSPSTSNEVFLSVEQSFCRGESYCSVKVHSTRFRWAHTPQGTDTIVSV